MTQKHSKTVSGVLFIIQVLAIFWEIQPSVSQCNVCPDGWLRYKNSCYYFSDARNQNFSEAINFCAMQNYNAHLVALETVDENDFIRGILQRFMETENNYWIGATDSYIEDTWVWVHSGSKVTNADWAPGQPNDYHGHEDCAAFDGGVDAMWKDFICYGHHRPLCELELPNNTLSTGTIVG